MTVLVAVSGSPSSMRAVRRTAQLFDPAEVVVATAVPGHTRPDACTEGSALRAATGRAAIEAARAVLSQARGLVGPRARAVLLEGDPVVRLCDMARAEAAEAIIVGSLGTTMVKRLVQTSIASDLVAEAPCSVIDLGSTPLP